MKKNSQSHKLLIKSIFLAMLLAMVACKEDKDRSDNKVSETTASPRVVDIRTAILTLIHGLDASDKAVKLLDR